MAMRRPSIHVARSILVVDLGPTERYFRYSFGRPQRAAPHHLPSMKGFVPTPPRVVDLMVSKLFRGHEPTGETVVLDPGRGEGEFIAGIVRWCERVGRPIPPVVGIESHTGRAAVARARFAQFPQVEIRCADFLSPHADRYTHVVGNPPYVAITALSVTERESYRRVYAAAKGRFDLYLLFFEQALKLLAPRGQLVFITPEKFLYVDTAAPLREILSQRHVDELHFVDEQTFGELVTYPLISTITNSRGGRPTRIVHRDGTKAMTHLAGRASWLPAILKHDVREAKLTLADVCLRISCGVATGADPVFVIRNDELTAELAPFAHPTISGRQIRPGTTLGTLQSMLVPYDNDGRLLPEDRLGPLRAYLSTDNRRTQLLGRTCTARRKWYAFHETPPLSEMRRPKLLCKDVTAAPFFVPDYEGRIVPRHSTYYIVPNDASHLDALAEYLNSPAAGDWLRAHCQRAAKGFLRLQSQVLKRLPLPPEFAPMSTLDVQLDLAMPARPA